MQVLRQAALALAVMATPAAASGGLECSIKDKSLRFAVNAGVTRGMGSPSFDFRGKLEVLDKVVALDLRDVTFDGGDRPQYWLDGKELRLLLYKERGADKPFGSVELEIRTKVAGGNDSGVFRDSYKLSVYDLSGDDSRAGKTTTFAGKVACFSG